MPERRVQHRNASHATGRRGLRLANAGLAHAASVGARSRKTPAARRNLPGGGNGPTTGAKPRGAPPRTAVRRPGTPPVRG
eukprot:11183346-Lingulodinium_polyedra.AAC.1